MNDLDRCAVCGGDEPGDHEGMAGCPVCLGVYCANCGGYNKHQQLFVCKNCEYLPPPPGDADESRVASLRSRWAYIGVGKPGMRSVQQEMKPDVEFLLTLAEEALQARRGLRQQP